ncbi:unnamed protein product, partial [Prorocentrum cordatum]
HVEIQMASTRQRRLALNDIKHARPADGPIIRDPNDMADATRSHWETAFAE